MNGIDITGLDLDAWEKLWQSLSDGSALGFAGVGDFIRAVADGSALDGATLLDALANAVKQSFSNSFAAYVSLIAVAILSSVMALISREKDGLGEAAGFLCFGLGMAAVSYNMARMIKLASSAIETLTACMETVTPVMSAALAATGSAVSGALMQPLTAFLTLCVARVFKDLVLPLVMAAGMAAMLGSVGGNGSMKHLFGFMRSAIKWITGAVFTVYFGIVSIQGITVARGDSIMLRTARYTLDKSVPIVGSAVSGSLDALIASAAVIKNAAGAAAVVTTVLAVASPLIAIACAALACRAVAAICEPLGDSRIPEMLTRSADVCTLLFAVITAVAAMFMITVGLTFAAGNP